MYLFFTLPKCNRCKIRKKILDEKGIQYTEINMYASPENEAMARKYDVYAGGTLIDDETGKHIDVMTL